MKKYKLPPDSSLRIDSEVREIISQFVSGENTTRGKTTNESADHLFLTLDYLMSCLVKKQRDFLAINGQNISPNELKALEALNAEAKSLINLRALIRKTWGRREIETAMDLKQAG